MKRIYACFAIVAALLATAFYSSFQVQRFADDISTDLDCAIEAIRNSDLPTARQALARGADRCDRMREKMNHLLRTEDFTELEAALRTADGHLEQNAPEEAFGELRRAQVQVETLQWLARRVCVNTKSTASLLLYRESGALQITGYCASFRSPMSFFSSLKKLSTSANCR